MSTTGEIISQDVTCSLCSGPLVAPVFAFESSYVCGRCDITTSDLPNKDDYTRQYLFENLRIESLVECCYSRFGCEEKFPRQDLNSHEKICVFRRIHCPFYAAQNINPNHNVICNWIGHSSELDFHIEKWHRKFVFYPAIFPITEDGIMFFSHFCGQLFTILMLKSENGYDIGVFSSVSAKDLSLYRYQLELFNKNGNTCTLIRKTNVLHLHDLENFLTNRQQMMHFKLTNCNNLLKKNHSYVAKITIALKTKKEIQNMTQNENDRPRRRPTSREIVTSVNDELLQELKCPVCSSLMVPPIYICSSGHSICSICKTRITNCPTCNGKLKGTRNFTLEKLTTCVDYPCRNRNLGCFFSSTSDRIRQHEAECQFLGKHCVFRCVWNGSLQAMVEHVHQRHKESIFISGDEYKLFSSSGSRNFYWAMLTDDEVFRVAVRNDWNGQGMLKFAVQQVGFQERNRYKYEVEILDKQNLGIRYVVSSLCQPLARQAKDSFVDAIIIVKDCLKHFIKENSVSYKISISAINR